ncbi:MAG: sglT 2, partial [Lacunisphaera sp.]|nr:sglT 2 [Lacunisphaera sp.]
GKLVTLVLGLVIILTALKLSTLKEFNLFLQMQRVSILIGVPITVPLVLALIIRRTPSWSGWSTVAVGFAGSLLIDRFLSPEWAAHFFHHAAPDATTREYWRQGIQLFGNVALGTGWFLFSSLFWNASSAPHRARVETFLERIDRPIDFAAEEGAANANDARQSAAVGWLALTYGSFVMLLALIPNPPAGRVAFLGCGGLVALVGLVLIRSSLRTAATTAARPPAA